MREPPASIPNRKQDSLCGFFSLWNCAFPPPSPSLCSPWRSRLTTCFLGICLSPPDHQQDPRGQALLTSFSYLIRYPFLQTPWSNLPSLMSCYTEEKKERNSKHTFLFKKKSSFWVFHLVQTQISHLRCQKSVINHLIVFLSLISIKSHHV